jgi:putative intracellular protease/amidase
MTKVLIVLSAADKWTRADGSIYPSGVWAREFVDLDEAFLKADFQVDLASPGGVAPTIDKKSLDPKTVGEETAAKMRDYLARYAARLDKPMVLAKVDASGYDALVIPGGHGPVEDLYKDPDMGRLLIEADRDSKLIAAVCHGPAAFLAARGANGEWPFAGRRMTSLTHEEEVAFGTADNAPWLLADTLRERGAVFEQRVNWAVFTREGREPPHRAEPRFDCAARPGCDQGARLSRDGGGRRPAIAPPSPGAARKARRWRRSAGNGRYRPTSKTGRRRAAFSGASPQGMNARRPVAAEDRSCRETCLTSIGSASSFRRRRARASPRRPASWASRPGR